MKKNLTLLCSRKKSIIKFLFNIKILSLIMLLAFNSVSAKDYSHTNIKGFNSENKLQQGPVKGTVTDSRGKPVIGASVVVKGTSIGTITDINGNFQLSVPDDAKTLKVTFIGMKSKEVSISGITLIDIQMEDEAVGLDEVVVIGYGTQKKVTVTGAVVTVGTAQLLAAPVANVSNSLGGRAPGLLVVQRSGEPGSDKSTLRIRGIGTFAGSQEPLILVDGIESTTMDDLDPNEIENISVLKDASATAVYGVRGANGVLLITTKRGSLGKPKFSITSNFASTRFTDLRERMDAEHYARFRQEQLKYDSYFNGTYTPLFTEDDFQKYKDGSDPIWHPNTNWIDLTMKKVSYQQQHNLNIRGGTDKVKYFVSAGYLYQGGLLNNTDLVPEFTPNGDIQSVFKRYNIRSNFDFNITKRLSLNVTISSQFEQRNGPTSGDLSGMLRMLSLANPISMPGLIDGKFVYSTDTRFGNVNALTLTYNNGYSVDYKNYLDGAFRANYKLDFITEGLSAHGVIAYKNYNLNRLSYWRTFPEYTATASFDNTVALLTPTASYGSTSITPSGNKNRYVYAETSLNYQRAFGEHSVTGLVLYNQSQLDDPGLQYVIPSGYQGLVGRVAYDFKSRYMAEFDFGYNGTENFAPGKRFGFFPAYSLGYVLSDEPFFPENNLVSFMKFRGSYGEVGNDKIGGERFLYRPNSYEYYDNAYYFGMIGSSISSYQGSQEGKIGNPVITWERAKKTNLGMDLTILNNKVKITTDVFREKRDNILTTRNTVPLIVGGGDNLPAVNIGVMENNGFDGEITYNGKAGKLNYRISANYTYAVNKVIYRDEVKSDYTYTYSTGQRFGQVFGSVDNGLYNSWEEVNDAYRVKNSFNNNKIMPGDINWRDINGDGVYDQHDIAPVGYPTFPEKVFGLSGGLNFRNIDFNFLFQGASNVTFNASGQYMLAALSNGEISSYMGNYWSLERYQNGDLITFPHPSAPSNQSNNNRGGTWWDIDASYIRLRNVELGYTLDKINLLKTLGLSSSRVYFNASNLFTWAPAMKKQFPGVDPENIGTYGSNEPYPRTTVVNFGININF